MHSNSGQYYTSIPVTEEWLKNLTRDEQIRIRKLLRTAKFEIGHSFTRAMCGETGRKFSKRKSDYVNFADRKATTKAMKEAKIILNTYGVTVGCCFLPCYLAETFKQCMVAELAVISLFLTSDFAGRLHFHSGKAHSDFAKQCAKNTGISKLANVQEHKEHKHKMLDEQMAVGRSWVLKENAKKSGISKLAAVQEHEEHKHKF
jgi:hypothetical protein